VLRLGFRVSQGALRRESGRRREAVECVDQRPANARTECRRGGCAVCGRYRAIQMKISRAWLVSYLGYDDALQ
jgi:hypothetical protein